MTTGVVVVAAGLGERLGRGRPKALVELAGEPLLRHALRGLAAAGLPPAVVVHTPGAEDEFTRAIGGLPVHALVPGGQSRTASVAAGLAAVGDVEVVLVHDAARALMPPAVTRAVAAAVRGDVVAAAPGLAVTDTLKRVAGTAVVGTVDRADLVAVQTPQAFARSVLVAAHGLGIEATDDLALVETLLAAEPGAGRIQVVPGDQAGLKVTHPADLVVAEALLSHPREA